MAANLAELLFLLPQVGVTRATRLGIELSETLPTEDRRQFVSHVAGLAHGFAGARQTLTAWLGDALVHCADKSRGLITECAAAAGLDPGTVRNAKLVCSRIPLSRRHDALTWAHHCEVALIFSDPSRIEEWLTLAEAECLSTHRLRLRIRSAERACPRRHSSPEPVFNLLRHLRACDRLIARNRVSHRHWSTGEAGFVLGEIAALTDFIEYLQRRAGRSVAG